MYIHPYGVSTYPRTGDHLFGELKLKISKDEKAAKIIVNYLIIDHDQFLPRSFVPKNPGEGSLSFTLHKINNKQCLLGENHVQN